MSNPAQIPEAWIGQEVTVYFGLEGYRQPGILESVSERGIVVQSGQGGAEEHVFWYPHTSVLRLMRGKHHRATRMASKGLRGVSEGSRIGTWERTVAKLAPTVDA